MVVNFLLLSLGGFLLYLAFKTFKKYRLIEDTPTSQIRTATQGHIEVKGVGLNLNQPRLSNKDGTAVVYKALEIQEEITIRDLKEGSRKEWRTIHTVTDGNIFYLKDPTGVIEVLVRDFDIDGIVKQFPYNDSLGAGLSFLSKENRTRAIETSIPAGQPLLMQGKFVSFPAIKEILGEKVLGTFSFNENLPSFITIKNERAMIIKSKIKFVLLLFAGLLFAVFGIILKMKS